MIRPYSQNARILRALGDGRWRTVASIHRKAGTSRLNSRVSELRKHGFQIEHEVVPGKQGALGHRYRLLNPPSPAEMEAIVGPFANVPPGIPREEVPRDSTHRFRIYRTQFDELDLVGTASTPEDIGAMIISLGKQGAFVGSCVGLLDTYGTDGVPGTWILDPFDTSPS